MSTIVYNIYNYQNGKGWRMDRSNYRKLVQLSEEPQMQEQTIAYLVEHLRHILKKQEPVLLCFLEHRQGDLSWLMEQAILRCDAVPVVWGPDHRWKTLLQQAFFSKASTVIGPPLVVLGLAKLQRQSRTPLSIRKVITAEYPCMEWMVEGIAKVFDSVAGGCFTLEQTGVVAGFACGRSWGVHLRSDVYGVDIVDKEGNSLPEGQIGEIVLYPVAEPSLRYPTGESARLVTKGCDCGSDTPRLLDFLPGTYVPRELVELGEYLQKWTSVLDIRMNRGERGLELEIVCFPGEKLPKLPSAAKLIVRAWNPQTDEPFAYSTKLKNSQKMQ